MSRTRLALLLFLVVAPGALAAPGVHAAEPPLAAVTVVGPPAVVYSARRDGCDGHDMPDAPLRAFRDPDGGMIAFGLHWRNRALRGPDLGGLRIDCRVVLDSGGDPDPARYADRRWIAATWTADGRRVAALLHHEYQGNTHPGRCPAGQYMACWYNTVTAAASADGGLSFQLAAPPAVVAAAPFRQEVGQGRHRGFFNPSNIVTEGRFHYMLAHTTGWEGQPNGVCLFRTADPFDPGSWRAFDGAGFTAAFPDPYRTRPGSPRCRPVGPFPAPVGAVVRHRASGAWIAVFQASKGGPFPEPGFYATSSRDLLTWDVPRLVLPGKTLYDDPCGAGSLIAYPSLIDREARGRNFDDVGDRAELTYATLKVEGCAITSERDLVRRTVALKVWP